MQKGFNLLRTAYHIDTDRLMNKILRKDLFIKNVVYIVILFKRKSLLSIYYGLVIGITIECQQSFLKKLKMNGHESKVHCVQGFSRFVT